MDITPIYELRERLKAGAIAGTDLITEDFRLKRAVAAMAPLEAAAPIFAKVGEMARAVIDPECNGRPEALLDAITLVDAVLCTQGAVAVNGPLEPVEITASGEAVNAPYSTLAVLLDALTGTGGGRFSIVADTHKQHPELFRDYRVKPVMVKALGASYSELAELVEDWLKEEGESILPLLEKGFDPKGKREMVRRVEVMDSVAGAAANDFYLSQLKEARGDVRAALIYALRHSQENEALLLELEVKEKGASKRLAGLALAHMESPAVYAFWQEYMEKKPKEAAELLENSMTCSAGKLVAEGLLKLLEPFEAGGKKVPLTQETAETINELLGALPGKSGPEVCDCYRRAAALGTVLDRAVVGEKNIWHPSNAPYTAAGDMASFSQSVPGVLRSAILRRPTTQLEALAMELYESRGEGYFSVALISRLLTDSGEACYEWVEAALKKKEFFMKKKIEDRLANVAQGLSYVTWDEDTCRYVVETCRTDPVTMDTGAVKHALKEELDERFFELLMSKEKQELDLILSRWIQPGNRELCAKLGKYFYRRALAAADTKKYLNPLTRCGWTDCAGLAWRFCRSKDRLSSWELYDFIRSMPGDADARSEEAQRVYDLVEKGKLKISNLNLTNFRQFILDMRNEGTICP